MKYSARELRALTGQPNRAQGENALYKGLGEHAWRLGERQYQLAGYDRAKDVVHFTATWAAEGGGFGHSRLGLPLRVAVERRGDLAHAKVLH